MQDRCFQAKEISADSHSSPDPCGSPTSSAALPRLKPLPNRSFQRSVKVHILLAPLPMWPEGCSNNSTLKSTSVREAFS